MIQKFNDQIVVKVWQKGLAVENNDPRQWRQDQCGAWIRWSHYGNRDSEYGWEIDHINPNGSDDLSNLRPLQWSNNVDKSDNKLKCPFTSNGVHNTKR